ncbi:MAG: RsmD family RNA methyltransferase [Lutibacter sp.]|nr:RsmD family RNA methyltransferase [Lutibacter sp.]MBP9601011.1 RsmD family RNA methyltransferase [Lutibacter sp.]
MNLEILTSEVQDFISENLKSDITKLILKGSPFNNITIQEIAAQIVSKNKTESKLPTWFSTKNIYYPNKLNIEQTSSETTAAYKSKLISGTKIIDLTGGLGVDAFYFSNYFKEVIHCELNEELAAIVSHNLKQLKNSGVKTMTVDSIQFLTETTETFDCIYIDPSRRNDIKGKVFLLNDCLPNVPKNLELLFSKTNTILIKVSPILDITSAVNELKFVKEVHVVAIENEVKELLFLLEKGHLGSIQIKTINFSKNNSTQTFNFQFQNTSEPILSEVSNFLYEPNAAILKAAGFSELSIQMDLPKLHKHSHLYTSNTLIQDFPGRKFIVLNSVTYNKKVLKKLLPEGKANITTRNFPDTVEQIRKKTGIKEGGTVYLFFTTTLLNELKVLICTKT